MQKTKQSVIKMEMSLMALAETARADILVHTEKDWFGAIFPLLSAFFSE